MLGSDEAFNEAIEFLFRSRDGYVEASNIFHKAASIRQAVLAMVLAIDNFCHVIRYSSPLSESAKDEVRDDFASYHDWVTTLIGLEEYIPELITNNLSKRLAVAVDILERSHLQALSHLLSEDFKALFNESWSFIMELKFLAKKYGGKTRNK